MATLPIALIGKNPHRNFDKNPLNEAKLKKLEKSIMGTGDPYTMDINGEALKGHSGYWDNVLVAITDPNVDIIALEQMTAPEQYLAITKLAEEGKAVLGHGHHRQGACNALGIQVVQGPIRYVTPERLLRMFVEENNEDYGSSSASTLESMDETCSFIMSQCFGHDNFRQYKNAGFTVFENAKEFNAAIKEGFPSSRVLDRFFGGTWKRQTIASAIAALKAIQSGIVSRETMAAFPKMAVVRYVNEIIKAASESGLPPYLQEYIVGQCAEIVLTKDVSSPRIHEAAKNFKRGNDPIHYLKSGVMAPLPKQKLVKTLLKADVDLRELPGFDTDEWKEIIAAQEVAIEKEVRKEQREARRDELKAQGMGEAEITATLVQEGLLQAPATAAGDGEETGDQPTEGDVDLFGGDQEPGDSTTTPEGAGDPDAGAEEPEPEEVPDYASDAYRNSPKAIVTSTVASLTGIRHQLVRAIGQMDAIKSEADEAGVEFMPVLTDVFKLTTSLLLETEGAPFVRDQVKFLVENGFNTKGDDNAS